MLIVYNNSIGGLADLSFDGLKESKNSKPIGYDNRMNDQRLIAVE